jgi:hypothetical protein
MEALSHFHGDDLSSGELVNRLGAKVGVVTMTAGPGGGESKYTQKKMLKLA